MLKLSGKVGGQKDTKIFLEAMSKDKVHLAKFILDAVDGKIVDSTAEGAQTPLISSVLLAESVTRSKFMSLLLQRGANVNHKDENGRTALSYGCERGYLDAVKLLVQHNADPEIGDVWGNTALMYAVVAGHHLVVEFLVKAFKRLGLQIDRQNKVGNSAPKVARYLGHSECLYVLTNYSRKVNDNTPISLEKGMRECATEDRDTRDETPQVKAPALVAHKWQAGCVNAESAACISTVGLCQRRLLFSKHHVLSMDSIEEYEKESDGSPTSPQGHFSAVLAPTTPHKSNDLRALRQSGKLGVTEDSAHLPRLTTRSGSQPTTQFSPRPFKSVWKSPALEARSSASSNTSSLSILMTPLTEKVTLADADGGNQKASTLGTTSRRFDDSYYQKRCSLPTSVLSSLPQDRAHVHVRKFRTGWRAAASPEYAEPAELPFPQAPTTLSALGNKLLRRFTFPELKKDDRDMQDCESEAQSGPGNATVRRMPRSETFPLCTNHPQVGSKPSIDSISAVKCEFDIQPKVAAPKPSH